MNTEAPTSEELLRGINAIKISRGKLSDCITVGGVSVWTFFQASIIDDIRRMRAGNSTKYDSSYTILFSVRLARYIRVGISVLSSFLFVIRGMVHHPSVLLFVSDQLAKDGRTNPRLTEVYAWLHTHHIRYAQMVHTTYDSDFFKNFRCRPVGTLYLDAIRAIARVMVRLDVRNRTHRDLASVDFSSFPSEYQKIIRKIVRRHYRLALESVLVVRLLSVILRMVRLQALFTIDDIRHHNELLLAAQVIGVKSFVFQHSNFDYFYGSDSLPPEQYVFGDYFVVWSRYWAQKLPGMSPLFARYRDRIVVGGRANAPTPPVDRVHPPRGEKPYRIFVPYEVNIPQDVARRCTKLLRECPDTHILFSMRADGDADQQRARYGFSETYPNVEVGSGFDLSRVDVAIGTYSTYLDDLVAMGVPVGVLHTQYRTFHDLSRFGLAGALTPETMCTQIPELAGLSTEERGRRRQALIDGWGNLDTVLSPFFTTR